MGFRIANEVLNAIYGDLRNMTLNLYTLLSKHNAHEPAVSHNVRTGCVSDGKSHNLRPARWIILEAESIDPTLAVSLLLILTLPLTRIFALLASLSLVILSEQSWIGAFTAIPIDHFFCSPLAAFRTLDVISFLLTHGLLSEWDLYFV